MSQQQTPSGSDEVPSLLTFPTEFPIKVMGKNTADFQAFVQEIIDQYIAVDQLVRIDQQLSSNEKYLSYTIVAIFATQAEIDTVYHAITASPLTLMAL